MRYLEMTIKADQPIADGSTRVIVCIGDPVAQVRAPAVWSALFRAQGVNALCIPWRIAPEHLGQALAALKQVKNLAGIIVTVPHKMTAMQGLDHATARAQETGAINAMRPEADGGWTGDMFDGAGFIAGLRERRHELEGRKALIVGAGGVGTAIAFALAGRAPRQITVFDVVQSRAEALANALRKAYPATRIAAGPNDPTGHDLIVNASPLGMAADDPLPLPADRLTPEMLVAEVVMKPVQTRLLIAAEAKGCATVPGTLMMDHAVPLMAEFFRFPAGDWGPAAIRRLGF